MGSGSPLKALLRPLLANANYRYRGGGWLSSCDVSAILKRHRQGCWATRQDSFCNQQRSKPSR